MISPDDLLLGAKALAEVNNEHVLALISLSELYPIVFLNCCMMIIVGISISGWSSPSVAHISHGCDGVEGAGGQSGGGEAKHGIS